MTVDPSLVVETLQLAGIVVGGGVALLTFTRDSRLRRTEWVYRLYEQFYENDRFKPIRRLIDYEPAEEIAALMDDVANDRGSELHEALVDYLNFFEFIAVQIKNGSLKRAEVLDMFDYYIRRLKDHAFIMGYLKSNGFENLETLLKTMKGVKGGR